MCDSNSQAEVVIRDDFPVYVRRVVPAVLAIDEAAVGVVECNACSPTCTEPPVVTGFDSSEDIVKAFCHVGLLFVYPDRGGAYV